jgi:hypothetical protein
VSNHTLATPATDHIGGDDTPTTLAEIDQASTSEAERLARVAELTLERFAPISAPGARSTICRCERAAVRHLERAAQRARAAADRTQPRLATNSSSFGHVTAGAAHASDVGR